MEGKWQSTTVGEIADSISDTHSFNKEQLIFLNTSDILDGRVLHQQYLPVKGFPGQAKKSIQENDILYSEIRPANGRYAYIDFLASDYVVSTKLMVIRARSQVLPKYLYYFLTSNQTTSWLQHLAESRSGTFPQITFDEVSSLEIGLPDISGQKAIIQFVDALVEKIELNRKINETLQDLARAIFKSWFVDFDPVRAKMEGRGPGLPGHIADLFPSRLVDSELGEIPEGWEIVTIGDLAEVVGGSTPSTAESTYWDEGLHYWATPKDLSALTTPVLLETARKITDLGLKQISSGLLPAGTVLLSSRAPIGYLAITEVPVAINQGFIAMKARADICSLYLRLWAHENIEGIISRANGSTFLEISKSNFRPIPAILPAQRVLSAFKHTVEPFHRRMVSNLFEARTLATLRDTLLPKLISGELRVMDAEKFIERAAK